MLKKHLTLFSGGYELSRDKTSYYIRRRFPPESHDVSTTRGKITKLVLIQHSRPQRLSVLIDQKKRWALRMMVKRTCAHAQ